MSTRFAALAATLAAALGFGPAPALDLDRDPVAQLSRLSTKKRQAALDKLWIELVESGQVPWRQAGEARFLFRGAEVQSVAVAGDHNRWQPTALERLEGTDLWWRADSFSPSARIDYKLVVDGDWVLDPSNDALQRSGFGDNSELAMPEFEPSSWTAPRSGEAPPLEVLTVESAVLERDVTVRLHRPPAEHLDERALSLLIVSDGHEYADDALGALPLVADRLLAAGRMRPTVCAFVDPRDASGVNRRASELGGSGAFGDFVAEELLDALERHLGQTFAREDVATLGTSLGGVASALVFAAAHERVGAVGIHSPALWVAPGAAQAALTESASKPTRVFLAWGTINDGGDATTKLGRAIEAARIPLESVTADQGHSWGLWSWVMDETLETLLPPR
ncbi:MAG: alpha/beta hydrolase-fold protein [Planctomycetota bacterium]